jgi:enoyl-CoA hydratase/carnithine racemase
MRLAGETCLALYDLPIPTIARVDGVAVGAGMNIALACDFVIATVRARFCEIFVKRGLSPDFGGSWILPRLIGLHQGKQLVLLGGFIDASAADRMGLIHQVVLPGRLTSSPALAVSLSKRLLNDSLHTSIERALDDEARAQAINLTAAERGRGPGGVPGEARARLPGSMRARRGRHADRIAGWSEPGLPPRAPRLLEDVHRARDTSTATTSEIASSAIIMSLDQGRIAETSVGLNAAAVVNDRCR